MTLLAVGTDLPSLELPPISRTTLALFAGASGDHNPIHIDIDVARSTGIEDVFAHGMLSLAYVARMLVAAAPQSQLRGLSARFLAITPVHAQPVCTGRVTSLDEGLATVAIEVRLADGTTTVRATATVAVESNLSTAGTPDTEHEEKQ